MIQSRGNRAAGVIRLGVEMLQHKRKTGNKTGQRLRDMNRGFTVGITFPFTAFPMFANFPGSVLLRRTFRHTLIGLAIPPAFSHRMKERRESEGKGAFNARRISVHNA